MDSACAPARSESAGRNQALIVLSCALAIIVAGSFSAITAAEGRLLQKTVEFTGEITFLEHKVPGLVIGAVRNGERAIAGFGTTSTGSSAVPDGKTIFRIGSVTKAFTGAVLASTAVEGTIALTDRLEQHLGWDVKVPTRDGKAVRLFDLATHSGGFPREVPHEPGPTNDPFSTITKSAFVALLSSGLNMAPTRARPGKASLKKSSPLLLCANPPATGSSGVIVTIGIVRVALYAANTPERLRLLAVDDDGADQLALLEHRHGNQGPRAGEHG
jgi:CubicO group peptidase (beta-lactamase class C family)